MGRKKSNNFSVERLDCDEEFVDDSDSMQYIDYSSSAIATFSFVNDSVVAAEPTSQQQTLVTTEPRNSPNVKGPNPEKLPDNRTQRKQPYGITPPVDGEHFELKRTFVFRKSTVKMLNKLKAEHEDENVYLSSIVDEAIRYYFENRFYS